MLMTPCRYYLRLVMRLVLEGEVYLQEHSLSRAYASFFAAVSVSIEKIREHPQVCACLMPGSAICMQSCL